MAVFRTNDIDGGGMTTMDKLKQQMALNKANAQAKKNAAAQQQAQQKQQIAAKPQAQKVATISTQKIGGTGTGTAAKMTAKKEENVKASGLNTAVKTTAGTVAARNPIDPYAESQAVTDARSAMQLAQQNRPEYAESQAVIDARNALQQLQTSKPQGYESKYGPALEALMQQIQNPGKYNYEFNGDNLFKQYADMYTQQGKQAAMNAMGNAAALTGGYGNSYGQMAANQAYDQYLTQLYDRGMELRDRDYQQWLDERQNEFNRYNLMANADQTDYGRYRDTVSDWQNERDYATGRYDTERNVDYGMYRDTVGDWEKNRDYYTDVYNTETDRDYSRYQETRNFAEQQYQFDTEMKEKIREFDQSLNWEKMSTQQKYAAEYCMQVLAKGSMPTAAVLKAAGLSSKDAKKIMTQKSSGGGGGGGNKGSNLIQGATLYPDGKGGYVDANGKKVNLNNYDTSTLKIDTRTPVAANSNNNKPKNGKEPGDTLDYIVNDKKKQSLYT